MTGGSVGPEGSVLTFAILALLFVLFGLCIGKVIPCDQSVAKPSFKALPMIDVEFYGHNEKEKAVRLVVTILQCANNWLMNSAVRRSWESVSPRSH